jgi:Parvulin-like peptidyl-prolyl isomerase
MTPKRSLLLAACLLGLGACQPQSGSSGDAVATVNGKPISREFFEFYAKGMAGQDSAALSPEQREQLLDALIRAELVAQQAEKDGLTKETQTAALLHVSRLNVLQQAASQRLLQENEATEEELRAEYEAQIAQLPKHEYRARHILVATEEFANNLVKRLEKGEDFAKLAEKESLDSSKMNGGDLGWFRPDTMVKPFADAVVALKPGEFTRKPVQTQYGWHVIRLEETRDLAPPAFDEVRNRVEQIVNAKKFNAYIEELAKNAKIEKSL